MDAETQRVNNWLHGFYAYVTKENPELLNLYGQRIHFFPRQDADNTIDLGLDDLHEPYTSAEIIKRMRELFEAYAKDHTV